MLSDARPDAVPTCRRVPDARADRVGRLVAVLCAIHCAASPALLALTAAIGAAAWGGAQAEIVARMRASLI
jgi:hypothetical protein